MPLPLAGNADPLAMHDLSRLRAAAHHSRRVLPGLLGELVSREITAFADFGYRFQADALIPGLATEVLAMRTPPDDPLRDRPAPAG